MYKRKHDREVDFELERWFFYYIEQKGIENAYKKLDKLNNILKKKGEKNGRKN
jgi:hypothetical protein